MTRMLASVVDLAEARLVRDAGVDIIDLKNPRAGALGALPLEEVRFIVQKLGEHERVPVSATIGDLPMEPSSVLSATQAMAATGIDFVKIGFFPDGDWSGTIQNLSSLKHTGLSLIAVLFGDRRPDLTVLRQLAQAGFAGCMLDTMNKSEGSLLQACLPPYLAEFIALARKHGLLCGLAGSLRENDVPALLKLEPDYIGFRGALCESHNRTGTVTDTKVRAIRAMIA